MADAVAKTLESGGHLMVEAGTGTGKSLAYLIPAVLWAVQNDKRVVVSTYTKTLQHQILHHDIPCYASVSAWRSVTPSVWAMKIICHCAA